LESVAVRRWGQSLGDAGAKAVAAAEDAPPVDEAAEEREQAAVWNTLLELYLGRADEEERREKALRLLRDERLPYDPTHALILCATRGFTAGLVLLWERLGMYEDVLRFWMVKDRENEAGAGREVMQCLERYGAEHTHLYPLVLRFLTSSPELLVRHRDDVAAVLEAIQDKALMPPLAVIQVLSRNGVTSVGLVKEWLLGRIREATDEIHMVSTSRAWLAER